MNIYRITGYFEYTEHCGCEYCEGHSHGKNINVIVEGKTERDAAAQLINPRLHLVPDEHWYDPDDIIDNFEITELPEDMRLARLGMPSLFPLEEVT